MAAPVPRRRRSGSECLQHLIALESCPVASVRKLLAARQIKLKIVRIHDRVAVRQLPEFPQVRMRELRLRRTAASDNVDVSNPALGQYLESVRGNIGTPQLIRRLGENPADIDRDVSLTDDDGLLMRQIESQVAVIGMAVIPADKFACRVAACQMFPGYPHRSVGMRSAGEHDGVITILELLHADVAPDRDIAEESKPRRFGNSLVDGNGLLELRVVWGNAAAHQAEGRGQSLEHVDHDRRLRPYECLGGVEAGRPATNDRRSQRVPFCAKISHNANVSRFGCHQTQTVNGLSPPSKSQFRLPRFGTRKRLLLGFDYWQHRRTLCIDFNPVQLFNGDRILINCLHRTFQYARAAVDAPHRVDIEHLVVAVETSDRAYRDTVGETTAPAIIGYDGRQLVLLLG